ncbi:hypothetical protein ACFSRY_18695 [Pontibacter locisalis]|uniref:Uncharacterized protein n=1 Tax=Pontibacter locisalis TaxID=1719035 RepID=A0ABW5ISB9_9BACT
MADGLQYDVLLKWEDAISQKDHFGFNNVYIAMVLGKKMNEALLWVNHEYIGSKFISGYTGKNELT